MANTKVKISGFELELAKGIGMNYFYQQLEALTKKSDFQVGNYSVRVFTRIVDNLAVGLILTFKGDKRKLATEEDDAGKLKVNRIELEDHQTSTEASLFCFNPKSQRGVFTHYAGAASISIYSTIFNQAHKAAKELYINQKVQERTNFGTRGSKRQSRNNAFQEMEGSFLFKYIYQENDLTEIMKNLKSISEVEVVTELNVPQESNFTSLLSASKRTTQTVTFLDRFRPIENIRNLLTNFVNDTLKINDRKFALKLIGQSIAGEKTNYWIGDNTREYGFFEYDDYIEELPEDLWSNYVECRALSVLMDKVKKDECGSFGKIYPVDKWDKCHSVSDYLEAPKVNDPSASKLKSKDDFVDVDREPIQVEMIL
ncbi:hypothetical protein ACWO0M_004707 [Vibrio parahaemolyticus]|uniref:hypothetical protein n=1 Tax=Vibrio parahaemolyticus TaxID=670 RepID=UPI00186A6DFB|nr:hypothetical protein [Vibrio parahaemolyticus]ELB2127488.1 hypothetical protein [Vibrio parahaemolyticus]MBE4305360.1 hypothetical protein [Vibrio parahaemolyticus]MDF5668093.1 hypothetical protein [Vibrio parahaemolyticus]HAS6761046.1 hypothetical protein [Vibrio parahaemolyticus]